MAASIARVSLSNRTGFFDLPFFISNNLLYSLPKTLVSYLGRMTSIFGRNDLWLFSTIIHHSPRGRQRQIQAEKVVQSGIIPPPDGVVRHRVSARFHALAN